MLERLVTQDSLQYFTSRCHPTAGTNIKSNTLFLTDTFLLITRAQCMHPECGMADSQEKATEIYCFFNRYNTV